MPDRSRQQSNRETVLARRLHEQIEAAIQLERVRGRAVLKSQIAPRPSLLRLFRLQEGVLDENGLRYRLPVQPGQDMTIEVEFVSGLPEKKQEALLSFTYFDANDDMLPAPYPKTMSGGKRAKAYRYLDPKDFTEKSCRVSVKTPPRAITLELVLKAWQPRKDRSLQVAPKIGVAWYSPAASAHVADLSEQIRLSALALARDYGLKQFELGEEDWLPESSMVPEDVRSLDAKTRTYTKWGRYGEAYELSQRLRQHNEFEDSTVLRATVEGAGMAFFQNDPSAFLEAVAAPSDNSWQSDSKTILYFLHNTLPFASAGYATRSHGIASALKRAGWDPRPISRPGFPIDTDPKWAEQKLPKETVIENLPYRHLYEFSRKDYKETTYILKTADLYTKIVQDEKPRAIMAASNFVQAFPALIAARRCNVPFVYEARGFWELTRVSREPSFKRTRRYKAMERLEAFCASEAEVCFTLTTAMKNLLIERGVGDDHIELVHNAVDVERFKPLDPDNELRSELGIPESIPVIGYIGSHVVYEGLDDLVKACGILKRRGSMFRLLMVGDGAEKQRVLSIAKNEGLDDYFIPVDRVPHSEVERYYSLIDIAPFPRKSWPVCEIVSPLKPFEAMAMGKAVLVSSVEALEEIVQHEVTGLVFEKGNIDSLVVQLETLVEQRLLRLELGAEARDWVRRERTWSRSAEVMVKSLGKISTAGTKS